MKLLYELIDDQYENLGHDHVRKIVRGIVYNDKKEVALIHIKGDDIFGHRDYLETPGGGVEEGEELISALRRELREELGAEVDDIQEIGEVKDFYNLIKRKNDQFYFMCHLVSLGNYHRTDEEKRLFDSIRWLPIDDAISEIENTKRTKLSTLVIRRELPILLICKDKLGNL